MDFLVLDVGGSFIKYAIMNEKAEFMEKGKTPTPMDNIEHFIDVVGTIFDKYKDRIAGMAMSMPGRIDSDRGYLYTGGNLEYNADKEIVSILQKRCPLPITVENDGKCAALAEAWLGSLKDCDDGIVVILGTGVGGGIIKDKKLHKGKHFIAGELSFIFTNNAAFESKYSHMWGVQAGLSGLCVPVAKAKNLPIEEVDGYRVFQYANSGDEEVLNILDDYCYRLVLQLYNLQYIYDPEKIAIGGGISKGEILIKYIRKNIEKYYNNLEPNLGVKPEVVTCEFYNDSNLIGALYNYLTKYKL
ncbi:ROK family protein [Clostridium estertheticum]|uniref:ROK family protein n=1 Tax=Clostridium estertheticum TaxID=238834 RepID=UPI001CF3613B|nr:ROK family protein [Clostridium estertheticum]MCB2354570.1 ROK family protein [Clostridium estertheticum]MCB2358497.1 ROK family protein [Clostridium estertheticum]WAG40819.1 ROK family protein [Clostridium estertheticum]